MNEAMRSISVVVITSPPPPDTLWNSVRACQSDGISSGGSGGPGREQERSTGRERQVSVKALRGFDFAYDYNCDRFDTFLPDVGPWRGGTAAPQARLRRPVAPRRRAKHGPGAGAFGQVRASGRRGLQDRRPLPRRKAGPLPPGRGRNRIRSLDAAAGRDG